MEIVAVRASGPLGGQQILAVRWRQPGGQLSGEMTAAALRRWVQAGDQVITSPGSCGDEAGAPWEVLLVLPRY